MNDRSTDSPLLGRPTPTAPGATKRSWTVELGVDAFPYLSDHRLQGMVVLPGSAYLEMALAAATAVDVRTPTTLEAITFDRAFFVPMHGRRSLQIVLSSNLDATRDFAALELADDPAGGTNVRHASARICPERSGGRLGSPDAVQLMEVQELQRRSGDEMTGAALYTVMRAGGNDFGPTFQAIERLWRCRGEAVGALRVPATPIPELRRYVLHPVVFDAAVQVLAATADAQDRTFAVVGCERLSIHAPPSDTGWVYARLRPETPAAAHELVGDVQLLDVTGRPALDLTGVRVRCLPQPKKVSGSSIPVRTIAVAATFTGELLGDALSFWFDTLGLPAAIAFAPYNQVFQQLLDPQSLLCTNRSGAANVLLVRLEDWVPDGTAGSRPAGQLPCSRARGDQSWVIVPGLGEVAQLNSYETEFLYDEIFIRKAYLRHGLFLRDDACVFDVGANIGMFTLFVSRECPNAKIYAFEPAPPAFQALSINVSRYCPHAKLFNCGLSEANTTRPFTFYRNSSVFSSFHADAPRDRSIISTVVTNVLRSQLPAKAASIEPLVGQLMRHRLDAEVYTCETKTLSSIIRDHVVERIDLIKIDVEGGELGVLSGIEDEHWQIIRQIVIEIHDPTGAGREQVLALLQRHGFDDVVVAEQNELLRGTGLINVFARRGARTGLATARSAAAAIEDALERNARDLVRALDTMRQRTTVPCIVCLCPPSQRHTDHGDGEHQQLLDRVERRLADRLAGMPGVLVITPAELARTYPVTHYGDPHADELGQIPYTSRFFAALGTLIARRYVAFVHPPPKVLALDCDEILWKGRCGEDGPSGVQLDASRRALQEFVVQQHDVGMLICLCSRNNAEDVLGVFAHRRDMPLNLGHVSAWRLNWNDKSTNLASLAQELNVGLDTFVFIDDDPLQRAEVRAHCPEVLVLKVPVGAEDLVPFLEHTWVFDRVRVTAEDRRRTALYREDRERRSWREEALTFGSFLSGLELRVQIAPCSAAAVPRVAQLTQRTTQFNTTTLYRSEAQLRELMESGGLECLSVHVADRFGDYGVVGAMIVGMDSEVLWVDTFLLSCRALGRGVEHRMLAWLGATAQKRGASRIAVPFLPTGRNEPARRFLEASMTSARPFDSLTSRSPEGPKGDGGAWGLVFEIAASLARRLVFDPSTTGTSSAAGRTAVAGAPFPGEERPVAPPRLPASRYWHIAHELRDVDAIVQAIEHARVRHRPVPRSAFVTPGDDLERSLADLWRRVLGIEEVGVDDNFFDLGGTSFHAVRVMAELRETTNLEVSTISLFEAPTVRALATIMRAGIGHPDWRDRSASRRSRGERRRAARRVAPREREGRRGRDEG